MFGQNSNFISFAVKLSGSQPLKWNIVWLSLLSYKYSSTMPLSSIPIWIQLGSKKYVVFAHVLLHNITQRVNRLSRHPNTTPTFLNPLGPSSNQPLTPLTTPPIIRLNFNLNAYSLQADKHKLNWNSTVLIFYREKYLPFFSALHAVPTLSLEIFL